MRLRLWRKTMNSTIYTAEAFWPAFIDDLNKAQGHVLIQSPFLSYNRIRELSSHFSDLSNRGVAICVFVQQPMNFKSQKAPRATEEETTEVRYFKENCERLRKLNVHVNVLREIHAKLATIDDKYLWEGSLNVLSYANTKEHMRRFDSPGELDAVAKLQGLQNCEKCNENRLKISLGLSDKDRLKQLGLMISYHRNIMNLSQRKLAFTTGHPRQRISEIEHGANIKLETLLSITDQLTLEVALVPKHYIPAVGKLICEQKL